MAGAAAPATEEPVEAPTPAVEPPRPGRRRAIADVPEEPLWEGTYSPKAMLGTFILGAVLSVAVLVIWGILVQQENKYWVIPLAAIALGWIYLACRFAAHRLGIHYTLTNQMFYHRRGVLTRTTDRIEVIGIDDVTYVQGPIERLLGVGRINIRSNDATNPNFPLEGIENVESVAKLIDKARRAERLRRGMSVESLSIQQGQIDGTATSQ